jgi:large subunit ribosomal protein L31e
MAPTEKSKKPSRSAVNDVVTRDYTIHLHKNVFGVQFKKRYVFREHTGPSF